jgi:hypothetical protein
VVRRPIVADEARTVEDHADRQLLDGDVVHHLPTVAHGTHRS